MATVVKNSMYYTVGAIIKAAASFVLLPIFANILGAEQYGIFNVLTTLSMILGTLMTFAIERSLFRLYYDYTTEVDKTRYLSTIFWAINAVSLMIMLLIVVCGKYLVQFVGDVNQWSVLMPMVFYTFLASLVNFSQTLMMVEGQGARLLKVSLSTLVAYNVTALVFLYFYAQTVESLIYALLVANIVVFPLAYGNIYRRIRMTFSWTIMRDVLKYCIPMFVSVIFAWVINTTDRLFIGNMSSMADAGVYSLASKFVQFGILFLGAIFQAYTPYFYKITNTMTYDNAVIKLGRINDFLSFIISMIVLLIIIFIQPVLHLLFSSEYHSCVYFVYLLSLSSLFTQQTGLLNPMIYQNKKTVALSIIIIIAGCLSMVLNWLLIPHYGSIAVGFSNLFIGLCVFISTFLLARRNYYIPLNLTVIIYTVLLIFMAFFIDNCGMNLYEALGVKLVVYIVAFYLLFRAVVKDKEFVDVIVHRLLKSSLRSKRK